MGAIADIPSYWARWLKVYWWMLEPLEKVRSPVGKWVIAHTPVVWDVASLTSLSMIGAARWSVYDKPSVDDTPGRTYLVFETNFNGDEDAYFEAFSVVVPSSMRLTWKLGPFGGPHIPDVGRTGEFIQYINEEKVTDIFGYYAAYPRASTKMIRAALTLQSELATFDRDFRNRDPATFERGYDEFAARVQHVRDPDVSDPGYKAGDGPGAGALSIVAPVVQDEAGLRAKLQSLDHEPERVIPTDRTHFARWMLVKPRQFGRKNTDGRTHLLFSAWFDYRRVDDDEEAPALYAKALYQSLAGMNSIWAHCGVVDNDDPDSFWDQVKDCVIPMGIPFLGYKGFTVPDVKHALAWVDAFKSFAAESQRKDAVTLRDDWRATFPLTKPPFAERRGMPPTPPPTPPLRVPA
jgi:hypothetical protein